MSSQRQDDRSRLFIITGTNGTGKSTLAVKLFSKSPRKTLIIDFDGSEKLWRQYEFIDIGDKAAMDAWTTGIRKTYFMLFRDETLYKVVEHFRNGNLILDDCRNYCKPAMSESVEWLMIQRRQRMIDILALGHAFSEIPPRFYNFATDLCIFSTMSSPRKRKNEIRNFEVVEQAWKRVNSRATDKSRAWLKSGKIEDNIHYFESIAP